MNGTTPSTPLETFVQSMTERMTTLARMLGSWVQAEEHTLQALEEQLLRQLHQLGTALLSGLLALSAQQPSPRLLICSCGAQATFCRHRAASVTTLLGKLTYTRAIYHCSSCHHTFAPLDLHLQVAAGSLSTGLQELLALLGATQASFAQAASVLERLSLVQLCPNTVRSSTEQLGDVLVQHTQFLATAAKEQQQFTAPQAAPRRLYVSTDGVLVLCRGTGWREIKAGCVYTTHQRRSGRAPNECVLRTEQPSYSASLAEAAPFGWQLRVEAARRGVEVAEEVIVMADGAHWIWKLAEEHFPQATQIVDYFHASQYIWQAGSALHGEGTAARERWAKQQLQELWAGRVEAVLVALQPHAGDEGAVDAAISYYSTHRARMDYPSYRARGLQIGSGTIESTCKHLISARLKQAGMIWSEKGAEAVVAVRAWLKSERWQEAMALRPVPGRSKRQAGRREAEAAQEVRQEGGEAVAVAKAPILASELCERVRAELAVEAARHPWRRAWSRRQQRRQAQEPPEQVLTPLLA